jgi:hypothetical protein
MQVFGEQNQSWGGFERKPIGPFTKTLKPSDIPAFPSHVPRLSRASLSENHKAGTSIPHVVDPGMPHLLIQPFSVLDRCTPEIDMVHGTGVQISPEVTRSYQKLPEVTRSRLYT